MRWTLATCCLLVSAPLSARGQEAPADPARWFREARQAEDEHRPAAAADAYRRAIDADPRARLANSARRRLAYLEARSEGDFRPLATLSRFRAELRPSAAALAVFESDASTFPPGQVRREAWASVGEGWLSLGDPTRAEASFRALAAEPDTTDTERVMAQTGIARAIAARQGSAAGAAHLREAGLEASPTYQTLAREGERTVGRWLAWGALALFVLLVVGFGRRALWRAAVLRRALTLPRLLVGAALLAFPPWLATLYDHDTLDTFALVAGGSAGILALASWAGEALGERQAGRGARALVAAGAVVAVLSLGYLALDHADSLITIF